MQKSQIMEEIHDWLVVECGDEEAFVAFIARGEDRLVEKGDDLVWEASDDDYVRICTGNAEAQFYIRYSDLVETQGGGLVEANCGEIVRWYKEQS